MWKKYWNMSPEEWNVGGRRLTELFNKAEAATNQRLFFKGHDIDWIRVDEVTEETKYISHVMCLRCRYTKSFDAEVFRIRWNGPSAEKSIEQALESLEIRIVSVVETFATPEKMEQHGKDI